MKVLIYIFCFYFLYLAGIPCQDKIFNGCESDSILVQSDVRGQHVTDFSGEEKSHQDEEGLCSPMCSCACCKLQLEIADALPEFKEFTPFNRRIIPFLAGSVKGAVIPIFQPPKV